MKIIQLLRLTALFTSGIFVNGALGHKMSNKEKLTAVQSPTPRDQGQQATVASPDTEQHDHRRLQAVTPAPTTPAPITTVAPTTAAPITTVAPTTAAPATPAPTTPAPTTAMPATPAPAEEDDDGMMERCGDEVTACMDDEECWDCFEGTGSMDDNCPDDMVDPTDCDSISEHMCCLAGETCSGNDKLVAFVNCQIDIDECTLTELCSSGDRASYALGLSARWWIGLSTVFGAAAFAVMV